MKKLLFATVMVTGFGMAMPANAGGIGGAVGGLGGAVGGVGAAVGGSVGANVSSSNIGNAGGNIGNAGNVVSNVANFGVKAGTKASAKTAISAETRDEIHQISTLNSVRSVTLVDVNTLANASLNNALSRDTGTAPQVQAALANNTNVMMAIMAENPDFDMSSVVAADVRANGELVIYTQG